MTGLYDSNVLECAIGCCMIDTSHVPALIAANGAELLDVGEIRIHHAILRHLTELHARGESFDLELAASRIAEATGSDRTDCRGIIDALLGRAKPEALPLFLARLAALRFRRQLADLGVRAQNGCPGSELRDAAERATRAYASGATPSIHLEPLRFVDYRPDLPPPVAFGDPSGDAPLAIGDLVILAGESGSGKSLSPLDLGLAWTTRAEWLGFGCCTEPGRVLIVTSDGDGPEPVRARVCRLGAGRGLEPAALDRLQLRVIPADGFHLDDAGSFAALQGLIADFDPDLLGLETLSTLMGPDRDPYAQASVADFIGRRLRPLQLRPDATRRTLIVGHHLRKRQGAQGANGLRDRVAGSFYVVAGADAVIGFEPSGERGFTARVVKPSRWGLRFRPFHVRIDGDPPGPINLRNTGPLEVSASEQSGDECRFLEALAALAGLGPDGWSAVAEIKRRAGLGPKDRAKGRRLERAGKRLAEAGSIEAHPNRRGLYRIAPAVPANPPEVNAE